MGGKNPAKATVTNLTAAAEMTDSNETDSVLADPSGAIHLKWIWRFQIILLPIGTILWCLKSIISSIVFFAGGLLSLSIWFFHIWVVSRMLSTSIRHRWLYAILGTSKLVLIVFALRAIIKHFHLEALPFVVGLLLFVAAIMIEAGKLVLCHFRHGGND
jgi:hypothetical protein